MSGPVEPCNEAKIMEDSSFQTIDAVNKLLEKYNLEVKFKEGKQYENIDYMVIEIVDSNVGIG